MQRRSLPVIFAVLLALALILPSKSNATEPHDRPGWLIGFSVGGGPGTAGGNTDEGAGLAFRAGRMIGTHFMLHMELPSWVRRNKRNETFNSLSIVQMAIAGTFYPGKPDDASGGIYIRGGFGFGSLQVHMRSSFGSTFTGGESGSGILLGGGYEFRLKRRFALGTGIQFNKLYLDNITSSLQFTTIHIDLNWYLGANK